VKVLGPGEGRLEAPLPTERAGASVRLSGLRRSFGPPRRSTASASTSLRASWWRSSAPRVAGRRRLFGCSLASRPSTRSRARRRPGPGSTPARSATWAWSSRATRSSNMDAVDNVAFGLRMRGHAARARRDKAGELLDLVGSPSRPRSSPIRCPVVSSSGWPRPGAGHRARVLLLDERSRPRRRSAPQLRSRSVAAATTADDNRLRHTRPGGGALDRRPVCVMRAADRAGRRPG